MSDNWKSIKCGDNVTGSDTTGLPRMGRAIEVSPGSRFSVQIEAESGEGIGCLTRVPRLASSSLPNTSAPLGSRRKGHELMLVQRKGKWFW